MLDFELVSENARLRGENRELQEKLAQYLNMIRFYERTISRYENP